MTRLRVARVTCFPVSLPLVRPIVTAHETLDVRRGFVVRVEDESGCVGYGDAMPIVSFGTETFDACSAALKQGADALLQAGPFESAELRLSNADSCPSALANLSSASPCARAALDVALHDVASRRANQPLADWLVGEGASSGAGTPAPVPVHLLVAAETEADVTARAISGRKAGYRCFKLKVGALSLAQDLGRVAALRASISDADQIRLDANGAWSEPTARGALEAFAQFDIEFVEQPVAAEDLDALARTRAVSPISIAADEALLHGRGSACLGRKAADRLILKPAALGGLGPAWQLAESGLATGVPSTTTSFFDSALGVAAALHLAAAVMKREGISTISAAGIATHGLLQVDVADLPSVVEGAVAWPSGPGLGIEPDADRLDRLMVERRWEKSI